jgi:hypothetical protein
MIFTNVYKAKDILEEENIRKWQKSIIWQKMLSCSHNCTKCSKKFNIIVDIYKTKEILEENDNHKFDGKCYVVLVIA